MSAAFVQSAAFLAGLAMGTGSTLTIKIAYDLNSTDSRGVDRPFEKPLSTTFVMFVAMLCSLPIYFLCVALPRRCRRSKPSLDADAAAHLLVGQSVNTTTATATATADDVAAADDEPVGITVRLFFLLLVPAFFDLMGTALAKVGLMYCSVSVYQLVRCTVIVFTAVAKTCIGHRLPAHMWFGVALVTLAMAAVSLSSLVSGSTSADGRDPTTGILFLMMSCCVASLQYVFEEKVMKDDGAHPLVVVGLEGFWGVVLFVTTVFPWAYILPGNDVGSLENAYDSFVMARNSPGIQYALLGFFVTVALYNIFAVYLTHLMSSVWHAILDCFRPVSVWGTDLLIFYVISNGAFGEAWTDWSYLQLAGMLLLFFGTAVFNGNITFSCCMPPTAADDNGVDAGADADSGQENGGPVPSDFGTPVHLVFTPPTVPREGQPMPSVSFARSPLLSRSAARAAFRQRTATWRRREAFAGRGAGTANGGAPYVSAPFSDPTALSRFRQKPFNSDRRAFANISNGQLSSRSNNSNRNYTAVDEEISSFTYNNI